MVDHHSRHLAGCGPLLVAFLLFQRQFVQSFMAYNQMTNGYDTDIPIIGGGINGVGIARDAGAAFV